MPKKRKLPKGRKATNAHQVAKYAERRMFITEANRKRKQAKHLKNSMPRIDKLNLRLLNKT